MKKSLSGSPLTCAHTLTQSEDSVLALTATDSFVFAGTQSGTIHVWNLSNFSYFGCLKGHRGHVLSLAISNDGNTLFSAGDEGYVRVWSITPTAIKCSYIVHAGPDCGDIHALVYSDALDTIYLGCKNASLQYFNLSHRSSICKHKTNKEWDTRDTRFFDLTPLADQHPDDTEAQFYVIFSDMILPMAHNGFIFCLALGSLPVQGGTRSFLFSGSGDGTIKAWDITDHIRPQLHKTLLASDGSILALTIHEGLLISGAQDGELKVWDLETFQCIRTITNHKNDILSVIGIKSVFFTGSADGTVKKWNRNFECIDTMTDHKGIVLSMVSTQRYLFTGGNDKTIKVWDIPDIRNPLSTTEEFAEDWLLASLRKLVSLPSISSDPTCAEHSRQCAKHLKAMFVELGGESKIVPGVEGKNPLVLAKYISTKENAKNVLIYGHYDVQPAKHEKWDFPPFDVTGHDGYLYGRGVTDNKGPILTMLFAVSELLEARQLDCNVFFVIEGEEESGSAGFREAVQDHRSFFGERIDLIILSNSYWLDDETPCLTYGLRGVIHTTLRISSPIKEDLHSGVSGGAYSEPLGDMVKLLNCLMSNDHKVSIPGFYERITELSEAEREEYQGILDRMSTQRYSIDNLVSRWRSPTLTIHKIQVSGPESNTVIPRAVTAAVSMRIVPNQKLEDVCSAYEKYLASCFRELNSNTTLSIVIGQTSDWWVEDYKTCDYINKASDAIEKVWKCKPMLIREGGSIPAVPFLKSFFGGAPVVHIPMGQSTDNAHLPNERIRLENLKAGKEVVKTLLQTL